MDIHENYKEFVHNIHGVMCVKDRAGNFLLGEAPHGIPHAKRFPNNSQAIKTKEKLFGSWKLVRIQKHLFLEYINEKTTL